MPECRTKSALVLEDDSKDILIALSMLRSVGITDVCTFTSAQKAQRFIEHALANQTPFPDLLIVDLDLQHESGYELIRFWRSIVELQSIPLIVWSRLGEDHQQVCELFKVNSFVSKWDGNEALQSSIREYLFDD